MENLDWAEEGENRNVCAALRFSFVWYIRGDRGIENCMEPFGNQQKRMLQVET